MCFVPVSRIQLIAFVVTGAVALAASPLVAGSSEDRALAVSPGAGRAAPVVGGACPTFSWALADAAESYQIVVLDLSDSERPQPVLEKTFAAGISSWTPSGKECLVAGSAYVWTVRGLDGADQPLGGEAAWSAPLRFRVPGLPSAEDLTAALAVLERWNAAGEASATNEIGARPGNEEPAGRAARGVEKRIAEVQEVSGISAIRGENPAATGANFGVTGVSSSSAGAGLVGINLSPGPDLILDGVVQGQADTLLSQSGIDRPAEAAQSFNIQNSGGGGMALQVQGAAVSLAGHTHAGEEITSGTVADVRIAATIARDSEVMPLVLDNDGSGSGLDADTLDGADSASYQTRVTGICAAGQAMQGINPDGTVVCFEVPGPPLTTTVDASSSDVGQWTSIAIGADGLPVISYQDASAGALKVAKCNDPACVGDDETVTTVDDPSNNVGRYTSIAIGDDGFPVISYHDGSTFDLMVAKCNDPTCAAAATITRVDSAGHVGTYSSLAIGSDGFPVISYFYPTGPVVAYLKVTKCNDAACEEGGETTTIVDGTGGSDGVGADTSIAIGTDGYPVISHHDTTSGNLKVVKCNDAACAGGGETSTTVDASANFVGRYTSIAIGTDGYPVISYEDLTAGALKVAKCNDAACAGGDETINTVADPLGSAFDLYTSLAIGTDGFPVVSYYDPAARKLKVLKCDDDACAPGGETIATVDASSSDVGRYTSIAIGADGFPVISYQDVSAGALKVAKCRNTSCSY